MCKLNVHLPVFEIVDESAAQLFLDGLLGFIQKTFGCGVSDGQRDDAAGRQGTQQLGQPPTVVAGVVRVVALREEHGGRVLVDHAQVDASAEGAVEGVALRAQTGGRDASGEQRPGDSLSAVELQSAAPHDSYELVAEFGHFGHRRVVGAAHQGDGGARAVAALWRADVKGSAVFYEDVTSSQGYAFGAVGVVRENDATCEQAARRKEYLEI